MVRVEVSEDEDLGFSSSVKYEDTGMPSSAVDNSPRKTRSGRSSANTSLNTTPIPSSRSSRTSQNSKVTNGHDTKNGKWQVKISARAIEPDTCRKESDNASTDSDEGREAEHEEGEGPVRRLTRSRYPLRTNPNDSWILGGGAQARGYPSRRSAVRLSDPPPETSPEGKQDPDQEDEADEEYVDQADENAAIEEDEEEEGDQESSDDLYTRVKGPDRRSSRIVNYRESSQKSEKSEEPISKRLRRQVKKYQAKSQSPQKRILVAYGRNIQKRRRRRRMKGGSSSSSSSSSSDSDSDRGGQPKKRTKRYDMMLEMNGGKKKNGFTGDLQPLAIDSSVNFAAVGGLELQIDKLKEMVIFPIIYKDFFKSRNITPPRGILFHGPPGTGKTLLARALATEASLIGGREVSFFMRKGADILNKWIGESERQLKLLFEQASLKQPSIIFFDEIDGLAPVRSSKTDQIHNSIVSTLLAEMDGLKDRGDVIVIGATNRVDTLDPALRRPGRFDHEFQFFLPSFAARRDILRVNVSAWKDNPVPEDLVNDLAMLGVGYSGADLKLLCSEASMCALRRRYPQIYTTNQKLVLNYDDIKVERRDWEQALMIVSRSTDRSMFSPAFSALPLPTALEPLFADVVEGIQQYLTKVFPYKLPVVKEPSPKTFWLYTDCPEASEHVIPAVLHGMDSAIPILVLSVRTLALKDSGGEAVAVIFAEATRRSSPCVIYIPSLDEVYNYLSPEAQIILKCELRKIVCNPVLIMASVQESLPEDLRGFFVSDGVGLKEPSVRKRKAFFKHVFRLALEVRASSQEIATQEQLEIAPPEPKRMSAEEISRIERTENQILRELRIFLREIIFKLARNKKFTEFTKPVDIEEVPDYLQIISDPMDLESMMIKVNQGLYHSAREFLDDIDLIFSNALNYNPAKSDTDRRIRHRAYELKDFAHTHIDVEMDSDFEDTCLKIVEARQKRDENETTVVNTYREQPLKATRAVRSDGASPSLQANASRKRRHKSSWSKGVVKKPTRKYSADSSLSTSPELLMDSEDVPLEDVRDGGDCYQANEVSKRKDELEKLYDAAVHISGNFSTRQLLELRFQLLRVVEEQSENQDKTALCQAMKAILADWKLRT